MRQSAQSQRVRAMIENPRKGLWTLTIPLLFGMMFQTLYMIVDMIFVGMLGSDALTAMAFNMPPLFFALGLVFGLSSGITAVIARYIGAGDKNSANNSADHAILLGLVLGSAITSIGLLLGKPILLGIGVPEKILPLAWAYFKINVWGYSFLVLSVFFRAILSGEGDTRTPTLILAIGTVLNIILDPIFIFYLDLGIQGAAWATVVSQIVTATVFIYVMFFRKDWSYISISLKGFHFSKLIPLQIIKIGLPASFSMVVMSLGGGIFNRILVTFSSDAVAAYQAGSRIDHLFLMPAIAISASMVTLVGIFYGAQRIDLVRSITAYGMKWSAFIGVAMGILFFVFSRPLIGMFTQSEEIIHLGSDYLRYFVFSYPFIAISMTSGRILQGLGLGIPMLVITLLRVIVISISLTYLFVFVIHLSVQWVWIAQVIAVVFAAAFSLIWLRFGLQRAQQNGKTQPSAIPLAVLEG